MYSIGKHNVFHRKTPGFPSTNTRFPSNKRVHAPCPPRTHPTSLKRNTWIPLCLSRSKQNVRKHGARTEHVRSTYGARAEHVGKNHETRTPPLLKIRGYNIKTLRIVESLHFVVFSNVLRTCSVLSCVLLTSRQTQGNPCVAL